MNMNRYFGYELHNDDGPTAAVHSDPAALLANLAETLNAMRQSSLPITAITVGQVDAISADEALDGVLIECWVEGTYGSTKEPELSQTEGENDQS